MYLKRHKSLFIFLIALTMLLFMNGCKEQSDMHKGILILAPFGDARQNDQVYDWAGRVQDEFKDYAISVGFTGMDGAPGDHYPAKKAAQYLQKQNRLKRVIIFRAVEQAYGEAWTDMEDEMPSVYDALKLQRKYITEAPAFGYGEWMRETIQRRVEETCTFVDDASEMSGPDSLVAEESILNITIPEGREYVRRDVLLKLKKEFGFMKVRVIDNESLWVLLPVDLAAGGRNVIVPYFVTMTDGESLHHGTMAWDGDIALYHLPDGTKASRDRNTILEDDSSLEVMRHYVRGGDFDGGGVSGPEAQDTGILVLAPYRSVRENNQFLAWAALIQDEFMEANVEVGFCGAEKIERPFHSAASAAAKLAERNDLDNALIFKAVVNTDGDTARALEQDVTAARDVLGLADDQVVVAPGFGLEKWLYETIKARLEHTCDFVGAAKAIQDGNDLVASKSILNITLPEGRDAVPASVVRLIQDTFGFMRVRLMDEAHGAAWTLSAVDLPAGGRNVVVPYFTTQSDGVSLHHGTMTWDGKVGIYHLPDGTPDTRDLNTILNDASSLKVVRAAYNLLDATKPEEITTPGILLAAPYASERENTEVLDWSARVQAAFPEHLVRLCFTNAADGVSYPYLNAGDAVRELKNAGTLSSLLVFKMVARADGEIAAAMDPELDSALDKLGIAGELIDRVPGFGYGEMMYATIKARLERHWDFATDRKAITDGNDLVGSRSILNITLAEDQDAVPSFVAERLQETFGFKRVRLIDVAHGAAWTLPAVDIPAGGQNVVVPYFTTQDDGVSLHHGTMTWDGGVAFYYLPEGSKANRHLNTILEDDSSLDILRRHLQR